MATKASTPTTTTQQLATDFKNMDFEALLKEEAELQARQEQIAEAKKERADGLKKTAYSEIGESIKKYFNSVLNQDEITAFLEAEGYIAEAKVITTPPANKQGRRAIDPTKVLFEDSYNGASGRTMTFKMDDLSDKFTGGSKDFYATLKDKTFADLKAKFKPLFWEFAKTQEGQAWYKKHFSFIAEDIANEIKPKEEVKAEETATA